MNNTTLFILLALLSGCASSLERGNSAYKRSEYKAAAQHYYKCGVEGDPICINNLGVIHQKHGKTEEAIAHFRLAARFGEPTAINNLKRHNEPIPDVDLVKNTNQGSNASILPLLNAILSGYNKSHERNKREIVFCDTYVRGSYADTTCIK